MQVELVLLVISLLFFVSILVSKAGGKLGVPALLLFLCVGMLFGTDGLGIHFDSIQTAQTISTIALCIILFSGGMDTKIGDVKPVIAPGLTLATIGVFLTALLTGVVVWVVFDKTSLGSAMGIITALLLASTISSTDSASVFSILRSKGLNLKNNIRPVLELESGGNAPMAYVMTLAFISLVLSANNPRYDLAILNVVTQLVIGIILGFLSGKLIVKIINRINIDNVSLYPILVLSSCVFIFSITHFLHGNSYLAVYIGGLVIGNSKLVHKRSIRNFFDGLSWLSQLSMFLTLGLLVNPSELKPLIIPGLIVSFFVIFVARPVSVFFSMMPFRNFKFRDKLFISWVGLRGAVPIFFAIMCRAANVPHGDDIFNIVFICTLVSLVVQGTTTSLAAKALHLSVPPEKKNTIENFDFEFSEEIKSATTEFEITEKILANGDRLMDLSMPEKTLVIMVKRGEQYFVPTGKTTLFKKDKLLVISDNKEELQQTLLQLGVEEAQNEENKKRISENFASSLLNIIDKATNVDYSSQSEDTTPNNN